MKVPIASLVEDMDLYPRHAVDSVHVSNLAASLEAENELPPILIDKESRKIVDGWHRVRAYLRVFGEEAQIEAEIRAFPDRKSMVLEAIRRNTIHGRRLDGTDMVRAALMAQQAGANIQQIALSLHVTEERVKRIELRVATVAPSSTEAAPRTTLVPLKRSVSHLAGKRITLEQAEAHRSMPGTSLTLLTVQLTKALQHDLVDPEDEGFVTALRELDREIGVFLKKVVAA